MVKTIKRIFTFATTLLGDLVMEIINKKGDTTTTREMPGSTPVTCGITQRFSQSSWDLKRLLLPRQPPYMKDLQVLVSGSWYQEGTDPVHGPSTRGRWQASVIQNKVNTRTQFESILYIPIYCTSGNKSHLNCLNKTCDIHRFE